MADYNAADVLIVGNGALALFAAHKARQKGHSALIIGAGEPFERFLLLHENALRVLERNFGQAPGHALRGVRVLNRRLEPLRELAFSARGLRLHAMRYSALLNFLRRQVKADVLPARVSAISEQGALQLPDGRCLLARLMVVNTAAGFVRPRLRWRHRKIFRMGFIHDPPEREWAVQINDAGTYAIIVPFGAEAAVVSSGDVWPLARYLKRDVADIGFEELKLETWCGWPMRQGRVVHVGEAIRRVHPHTAQGLNRALDAIDALFEGRGLMREQALDCLMWAGGVLLDAVWGKYPSLARLSLALMNTRAGMHLAAGLPRRHQ